LLLSLSYFFPSSSSSSCQWSRESSTRCPSMH
jgi:hypothetical protein